MRAAVTGAPEGTPNVLRLCSRERRRCRRRDQRRGEQDDCHQVRGGARDGRVATGPRSSDLLETTSRSTEDQSEPVADGEAEEVLPVRQLVVEHQPTDHPDHGEDPELSVAEHSDEGTTRAGGDR